MSKERNHTELIDNEMVIYFGGKFLGKMLTVDYSKRSKRSDESIRIKKDILVGLFVGNNKPYWKYEFEKRRVFFLSLIHGSKNFQ